MASLSTCHLELVVWDWMNNDPVHIWRYVELHKQESVLIQFLENCLTGLRGLVIKAIIFENCLRLFSRNDESHCQQRFMSIALSPGNETGELTRAESS